MNISLKTLLNLVAAAAIGLAANTTQATEMRYYKEGEVPRPIDVAQALMGQSFKPMVKRRGIALDTNAAPPAAMLAGSEPAAPAQATAEVAVAAPSAPAEPGPGLAIAFGFDSAELAPQAREVLDSVAEGIKITGDGVQVLIEGHTDAVGAYAYNDSLSVKRARAVLKYLRDQHGIDASRLHAQGRGEHQLRNSQQPDSAENRRVEFKIAS